MKHLLIFFICCILSCNVYGIDIKGRFVTTSQMEPFRVVLTSCDTLNRTNVESTFYEPTFNVSILEKGRYTFEILQNNKVVYNDSLTIAGTDINLGDIRPLKTVDIKEVEVRAKKIDIHHRGRNYTITNIQGTHIGDAGNLVDMLKWTPGVTVSRSGQEEQFEIIGGGKAIVYVNGRKVNTSAELRGQQSNLVTKIEIIRQPDVQYKAGTQAVIRITMRRPIKDYLGMSLSNGTSFNRKVSNSSTMDVSGKQGIIYGNMSFGFDHDRSLSYTNTTNIITHSADNLYKDYSHSTNISRSNYYNIFAGLNFLLSKKSLLAVQYSGGYYRRHPYTSVSHDITDDGVNYKKEDEYLSRYSDSRDNSYTLGYTFTRSRESALNLTASYTQKSTGYDRDIVEHTYSKNELTNANVYTRDRYKFLTLDGDYSFKIKGFEKEIVGFHYGHIRNNNPFCNNGVEQFSKRHDTWAEAFFKGGKFFDNGIGIELGVRYEYNASKLYEQNAQPIKTHYSFFVPNIKLQYERGDNFFELEYLRDASNPAIYELNPVVEFIDSLHYRTGNPALRPTYGNIFTFSANVSDVSFSASYAWGYDASIPANTNENGTNVIKYMPINSDLFQRVDLGVDYTLDSKDGKFSSTFFGGMEFSKVSYSVDKNKYKEQNFTGKFSLNASWAFIKNWRLFGDLFYCSPRMNVGYRYGYQLSSKIGISANFFKKRLRVSLQAKDLFNRGISPTVSEFTYLNVYEKKHIMYDSRGISLSIRYDFNNFRSKFRRAYSDSTTSSRASGR